MQLDWLGTPPETDADLTFLIKDEAVEQVGLELGQVQVELLLKQPNDLQPELDVNLGLNVWLDSDLVVGITSVLEPLPANLEGRRGSLEAPLVLVILEETQGLAGTCTHSWVVL